MTPRLVPDKPFPPYAYVSGRFPHPTSDPAGHSFGAPAEPAALDPDRWQACRPYLYGIDLFNHGYYWEAHEAWEGLWHGCGRAGPAADLLKGLIRLAAAGVKVREGRPAGVRSHAAAAGRLFRAVARQLCNFVSPPTLERPHRSTHGWKQNVDDGAQVVGGRKL